jgi:hypothetical protein
VRDVPLTEGLAINRPSAAVWIEGEVRSIGIILRRYERLLANGNGQVADKAKHCLMLAFFLHVLWFDIELDLLQAKEVTVNEDAFDAEGEQVTGSAIGKDLSYGRHFFVLTIERVLGSVGSRDFDELLPVSKLRSREVDVTQGAVGLPQAGYRLEWWNLHDG